MKFNIVSDLHLEFEKPKILGGSSLDLSGGEVLLIAGDLGIANRPDTYVPFLENYSKEYKAIYFVMGNHEHYHGNFDESYNTILGNIDHLKNVICLNNDHVELDNDIVLIGSTLWSDTDPRYEYQISSGMNDFHFIKSFNTAIAKKEFQLARFYIEEKLREFKDKRTIILTHHAPTLKCPEIYKGNILNSAYGSDLTDLLYKYKPEYWVHGHTHISQKYVVGETKIIVNPRGYVGYEKNFEFDKNLTIEL